MLQELETHAGSGLVGRNENIEALLFEAALSIDLTPAQRDAIEESYKALGGWLDAPESPLHIYRPCISPQGSLPLGTITKPLGRDDFDLDATCLLNVPATIRPAELKKMVGDRLKAHKTYKDLLEEKSRCWRVNYARDFHVDIIPAKPQFPDTAATTIWITDKLLLHWLLSNPKGYIAWFKLRKLVSKALLAKRDPQANVEPCPPADKPHEKAPLQIGVQLMKRHRDVTFVGRDDAPISIIITTLAGLAYKQEATVLTTLRGLIERMPKCIDYSRGYAYVANPTNPAENFADKWQSHTEREEAFFEWIAKLNSHLDVLAAAVGFKQVRSALIPLVGEKRADIVVNGWAEKINSQRANGLRMDQKTGLISVSSGIVVPKNTHFGDATV